MIDGRAEKAAAKAIDQYTHRDAPSMRPYKGIDKLRASRISAKNVARKSDAVLRVVNRGKHSWIGLIAAIQNCDDSASAYSRASDFADRGLQPFYGLIRFDLSRRRDIYPPIDSHQSVRATFHATYSKSEIENASNERGQPYDSNPTNCRADVAFVQQYVTAQPAGYEEIQRNANRD